MKVSLSKGIKAFFCSSVGILSVVVLAIVGMWGLWALVSSHGTKRTLTQYTEQQLEKVEKGKNLYIDIYLAGNLDNEFQSLLDATKNTLNQMNAYTGNNFAIHYQDPYELYASPDEMYSSMNSIGAIGVLMSKSNPKVIYPYAKVSAGSASLIVSLAKNMDKYDMDASIKELELEFADAIRILYQDKPKNIAFVEGHGELERDYIYDAEEILSKYYFINRGNIELNTKALQNMDAIIVAGPTEKYSEAEKYVLDQYIMAGGKVLWIVDGAVYSQTDLYNMGYSASIANDVNLNDMLFAYGVRINTNLVQDTHCASIYLQPDNDVLSPTLIPNLYTPLLLPQADHLITRNMENIKAGFASSIDFVNKKLDINKTVLLTSSVQTHLIEMPELIDYDFQKNKKQDNYFNESFVPIAVGLEGIFVSAFVNRMIPKDIEDRSYGKQLVQSKTTRMIVISSSQIISNEVEYSDSTTHILPMGYDKINHKQYANRDFVINVLNWLTDTEGWMELRDKSRNKAIVKIEQ